MDTLRDWSLFFSSLALLCFSLSVFPQAYPSHSIQFVVPVSPGGGADLMARLIAQRLSESVKQPVVVENRVGAGNVVGTEYVARARPDGYTLLLADNSSHGVAQAFDPKIPYDTIKDFTPITVIASAQHFVLTNGQVPANTIKQFIDLAKAKPGQLNFGSSGAGTQTHLLGELFKYQTKTDLVHIPYKGTGSQFTALVSNEIQLMFATTTGAMPFVKDGRLKALAITGLHPSDLLPDVPTLDSQGIKGFETATWYGVVGPAGIPKPIVILLNQEIVKVAKSNEFKQRIAAEGAEPVGSTPEECAETIKNELEKWTKLVKDTGLHA